MSTGARMSFVFPFPGGRRGPGGAAAPVVVKDWTPAFAGERSKK